MPAYNYLGYQNPYAYSMYPQTYNQQSVPQMPYQQQNSYSSGIIWVNNEKEAEMYPVAPNNAVTLWNTAEPIVYLKQADATGKPTLKTFDLVERANNSASNDKVEQYATKDEVSAIFKTMNDIGEALGTLRVEINSMKDDMYGIAGKKKTARKTETEVADE